MKMKRRGKIKRVNPVDFGLEELSKINKDNVVRVMDRSKERTGEKISSESGLYVPKREEYEMMRISHEINENTVPKRKVLSNAEMEDYSYGKTFAVGEQYLDNERYKFTNYNETYSYDDFEDTDDFSIEDFFDDSDELDEPEIKEMAIDDNESHLVSREIEKPVIADDGKNDEPMVADDVKNAADEPEFADDGKNATDEANDEPESSIPGYTFIDSREMADMFENAYLGIDQAASLRELAKKAQEDSDNADSAENVDEVSQELGDNVDPERERQLNEVINKLEQAATPKERLAIEREAVRLGMADVLTDHDGYDMVRPELLEEIGFTPGGEKEPEIVKNKRFIFGKKKKEKAGKTIAEKQISDNRNKVSDSQKSPSASTRERRSEVMHDPKKRRNYIIKNKKRLGKASEDLMKMQEKYENLTKCINDMVLLDSLPQDAEKNIKNIAGMVVKYRHETKKTKDSTEMDNVVYRKIHQNKDELPDIIRRLVENEKYADKLKREIDKLENEKEECKEITEDNNHRQKVTKNISIAVIVFTIITMITLIVVQLVSEYDMQIPILIFGVCAVLETLGIFVQHFRTETDETINNHKLNKVIKKQNSQKIKYVNAVNAVEYVYKKYDVHSSSELLFQWETYQRVSQAREDYRIAGNEVLYYEDRLFKLLQEYGFDNPEVWVSQAEYIVEEKQLSNVKEEMTNKRSKLMVRMDKCKKVIGKLDSELSVLVIKFPQYAKEIKELLEEY